jgi:protein KTI12
MAPKTIVILDSMNYIKGFRYEMFCMMRAAKTTYCVIYCNTKLEKAIEFHKSNKGGLNQELF